MYNLVSLSCCIQHNSYDNGIVFTDQPLSVGEHVALRFMSSATSVSFEACPSVGLSSSNPDSMRPEDLPASIDGWAAPGSGIWSYTIENAAGGEIVELWLTDEAAVRSHNFRQNILYL